MLAYDIIFIKLTNLQIIHQTIVKRKRRKAISYVRKRRGVICKPRFDYSHDDPECNLPIRNIALPHETPVIKVFKNERFKVYCPHCKRYFYTTIRKHLDEGYGCPTCPSKYQDSKRSNYYGSKYRATLLTNLRLLGRKIYNDSYDYSKVVYIDAKTKVCIICPVHGEFWTTPNGHLRITKPRGCKQCGIDRRSVSRRMPLEDFIKKANCIHNCLYDYSKVKYTNCDTKVCIICPVHGEFWQTPYNHTNLACRCTKCSRERMGRSQRYTTKSFIRRARKVHRHLYDYSKVIYINSRTSVCIICSVHGEFWQEACSHLQGHGCKMCADDHDIGFRSDKPGRLYCLKITKGNQIIYKIGITNRTITQRYHGEDCEYEVVYDKCFTDGGDALSLETKLKYLSRDNRYVGVSPFRYTGISEIFEINPMVEHRLYL